MRAFHTSHPHTRPQHPGRHVPPKNGMEPYALRPGPTIRKTSCVSHGLETAHGALDRASVPQKPRLCDDGMAWDREGSRRARPHRHFVLPTT